MERDNGGSELPATSMAPKVVCNVSHSFNDRPILFLPDRAKQPGIPEGWASVAAEGEEYEANFVQIAINVMRKPGTTENVLPELLQAWFGPDAGKPGRGEQVSLDLIAGRYRMTPIDGVSVVTSQSFSIVQLPTDVDVFAPDGSEIRVLASAARGSMAHGTLPPGGVSLAIRHRTVEELWFVTEGRGQVWRRLGEGDEIVDVVAGSSLSIPAGASFQFRNTSETGEPLCFIMCTMPPWPGPDEAEFVDGPWQVATSTCTP
ncbi:MAG TPA: cupin domain-containing protein [Thermomicrobiales bacterium]|nr:cupin domain-containing protein [Thermomicrobiales bacterium]